MDYRKYNCKHDKDDYMLVEVVEDLTYFKIRNNITNEFCGIALTEEQVNEAIAYLQSTKR